MKICLVTPAPAGSLKGNRVTAERWAGLLRELGHQVEIVTEYQGENCDLLIALHAFKSHASIRRFRDAHPMAPLVLGLTGTDLYSDIHTQPEAMESLRLANRLVLLQPLGKDMLPPDVQDKARVIYQSVPPLDSSPPGEGSAPVEPPRWHSLLAAKDQSILGRQVGGPGGAGPSLSRSETFTICVIGHLRPVKDPFRTALAARLLPDSSRIQVIQLGAALSEELAEQAREEMARNPRYNWLGEVSRDEVLRVLSRCRLLSLTSLSEGGANAISEAVIAGVPVISTHIAGSIGLLGEDYPGYFPVGDTQALAHLLSRAETDTEFYDTLRDHCVQLRPLFDPAREKQSWEELLKELVDSRLLTVGSGQNSRFHLIELTQVDPVADFAEDVSAGLTATPKHLSCRYFYDREGSRLFEAICELPEYYLTRSETEILQSHAREIAGLFPGDVTVIELGSGNAVKTRLLLEALLPSRRVRYVPIDICRPVLEQSADDLLLRFPALEIAAVAAEYHEGLKHLRNESDRQRLILWLGSNIGNFTRTEAAEFLRRIQETMTPADHLLVGVDLRKDRAVLEAAYDDAAGVTADFNLNLLVRINRELDGNFYCGAFQHRAIYNQDLGRIEMYLVSTRPQRVTIGRIGLTVDFAEGEAIHTENSYKYSLAEINVIAATAGLHDQRFWQDSLGRFSLHLLAKESD
jgi:dimethylhistidine N-methyltransferase